MNQRLLAYLQTLLYIVALSLLTSCGRETHVQQNSNATRVPSNISIANNIAIRLDYNLVNDEARNALRSLNVKYPPREAAADWQQVFYGLSVKNESTRATVTDGSLWCAELVDTGGFSRQMKASVKGNFEHGLLMPELMIPPDVWISAKLYFTGEIPMNQKPATLRVYFGTKDPSGPGFTCDGQQGSSWQVDLTLPLEASVDDTPNVPMLSQHPLRYERPGEYGVTLDSCEFGIDPPYFDNFPYTLAMRCFVLVENTGGYNITDQSEGPFLYGVHQEGGIFRAPIFDDGTRVAPGTSKRITVPIYNFHGLPTLPASGTEEAFQLMLMQGEDGPIIDTAMVVRASTDTMTEIGPKWGSNP